MLPSMKSNNFLSFVAIAFVASCLLLSVGCGGGDDAADGSAELSQLEAKATQGDGAAAFQAGEILANSGDDTKRVTALKWFYIARKLGNEQASMGIKTLEASMTGDDIMNATREAENFKVPGK